MELGIDLQYLLFLQNLRLATGGIFDEFFNGMSKVAVDVLPFLPFLIFLCVSKKWGYRILTSYLGADLLNGVVKLTVCAYRPWIRSDLIEPAGDSKVAATGYSFPSGHTVSASSLYGSVVENQWSKRRWLAVICIICILLTGFSRNFLGVHTPQDVLVGLTEGIVMILIVRKASQAISDNEKTYDILTLVGILVVIGRQTSGRSAENDERLLQSLRRFPGPSPRKLCGAPLHSLRDSVRIQESSDPGRRLRRASLYLEGVL